MSYIKDILERLTWDDIKLAAFWMLLGLLTMFGDILQGVM